MEGLLILAAILLLGGKKGPRIGSVDCEATPPPNKDDSLMSDAPKKVAYLYQLPQDIFTTTRMAVGNEGKTPEEMGIFGSPDAAIRLANSRGWKLAWDGVRQLSNRPGES